MNALAQGGASEPTDATDILSVDDEISPIDTDEA